MELLVFPLLAIAPGIFWLWFFVRRDRYRPEPKRLLAITFFLGMLSTIPAGILNTIFLDESILNDTATLGSFAAGMLFVVGPVEETSKFLAVRLMVFRSLYFDEPGDGLVYSAAASLGFASLENLLYILEFGPAVMIGRAPLSTLGHVIFGSFWGYALGRQADRRTRSTVAVLAGIAAGAVVHGAFNVSLFVFSPLAIALTAGGLWWTLRRFNWAQAVSPFRYMRNIPKVQCHRCGERIVISSQFCRFCGSALQHAASEIYCGNCETPNRADAAFCTACGDRLLRRLP